MLIKKNKIPLFKLVTIGPLPSFLKKAYYRSKGYKIGKNVSLGIGSVIIGEDVSIGDNTKIGFVSVIRARTIRMGRFVKIGAMSMIDTGVFEIDDDARINENVIVGGTPTPQSSLKMGKRTIVMQYSFVNTSMPVSIGDDSGIGGHCLLFTHGSWTSQLDGFPVNFAPITIGKRVWLPWRVFIMPGVTVGDEVVIGANSLVNKDLPSNVLAAGSPAKVIKTDIPNRLTSEERKEILVKSVHEFAQYLEYNRIKTEVRQSGDNWELEVNSKGIAHKLVLNFSETADHSSVPANGVIIHELENAEPAEVYAMVLNTRAKTRKGSTEIGEEFVQFISRYGIRFDRLD